MKFHIAPLQVVVPRLSQQVAPPPNMRMNPLTAPQATPQAPNFYGGHFAAPPMLPFSMHSLQQMLPLPPPPHNFTTAVSMSGQGSGGRAVPESDGSQEGVGAQAAAEADPYARLSLTQMYELAANGDPEANKRLNK